MNGSALQKNEHAKDSSAPSNGTSSSGGGSSSGGAMRSALRGASFDDGDKMLTPEGGPAGAVQLKGPGPGGGGGDKAPSTPEASAPPTPQTTEAQGEEATAERSPNEEGGPGQANQDEARDEKVENERAREEQDEAKPATLDLEEPKGPATAAEAEKGPAAEAEKGPAAEAEKGPAAEAEKGPAAEGGESASGQAPEGAQANKPPEGEHAPAAEDKAPEIAPAAQVGPDGGALGLDAGPGGKAEVQEGAAEAPIEAQVGGGAPPEAAAAEEAAPEAAVQAEGGAPGGAGAPEAGGGGGGGFVAPQFGPITVASPESIGNQNVESIIGPDPATGAIVFWGTPGPQIADENGNQVADSQQVPQGSVDGIGQQQADTANQLVDEFLAEGEARVATMTQERDAAIASVQGAIASEKARLSAGIATARQATASAGAAARATIAANAASARGAVQAGLADTIGLIDGGLAAARGAVEARSQAATGEVGTLRTTFTQSVSEAFSSGIAAVQGVGTDFAGRARTQGNDAAAGYRNAALPETSGWDDFWDGENFERNKRTARTNAASQVGEAYSTEFSTKAGEVATGLQGGAQQVITGAGATFTQAEQSLAQNLSAALEQLEGAAAQARQSAQDFATAKLAAVDAEEAQMSQAVSAGLAQANGQYASMQRDGSAGLDSVGNTTIQMLTSGYNTAISGMSGILEEVRTTSAGAEAPPDPDIRQALDAKRLQLETAESTARAMLGQQTEGARAQLAQSTDQSLAAATALQAATSESFAQMGTQSSASLTATQAAVAEARQGIVNGFTQASDQVTTQHDTAANTALTGLRTDTDGALGNVTRQLGQYATDLRGDFTNTLAGMGAKIQSEAAAAAAKVQPAWKSFVSILVKIIVAIVVAVAIAALVASTAGLGAVLLGGFLIGAAGAGATYLTDCALGLQEFSARGLVSNMVAGGVGGLISAATGGMAGGLGNMAGAAFTNVVASFAVNVGVRTVVGFVIASGSTAVQQIAKNIVSDKPWSETFSGVGQAVVDNALINLGASFASAVIGTSLRAQGGKLGTAPTGDTLMGRVGNSVGSSRTGGGSMPSQIGTATVASQKTAVSEGLKDGARGTRNQLDPNIAGNATAAQTRVGGEVRADLDQQAQGHDTPAPDAPWQFDPKPR